MTRVSVPGQIYNPFPLVQYCLLLNICQQLLKLSNSPGCIEGYILLELVCPLHFSAPAHSTEIWYFHNLHRNNVSCWSYVILLYCDVAWAQAMLPWHFRVSGISFALLDCFLHVLPFQKFTVLPRIGLSFRNCKGKPGYVLLDDAISVSVHQNLSIIAVSPPGHLGSIWRPFRCRRLKVERCSAADL